MKELSNKSKKYSATSNSVLFLLVIFTIFIIPLFPIGTHQILYNLCFTFIFLLSALALNKYRSIMFGTAVFVIAIEWFSELLNFLILIKLSLLVNILFFDLIVVLFILQIAKAKTVTPQVIFESINGYLMLGISFSILISLVCVFDPNAFNFNRLAEQTNPAFSNMSNYIYFGIITLTTIGYGDVVPITPTAKSLSNFIGITGQMYVAIIIAALVSKYLGQKSRVNQD